MLSLILSALLAASAYAAPAPADPSPTLITFTYDGAIVTATYYGTSTVANAPCPTQTFTYAGAVITAPYTGPGTPQSCLTAASPAPTPITSASGPGASAAGPGDGGPSVPSSIISTETAAPPSQTSVAPAPSSAAVPKGFNYGSSGMTLSSFETQFSIARSLRGAAGFTAARLYTMIQDGTTNTVISAIPAAIATNTYLLLGLFYPNVDNELAALEAAIEQYGVPLKNLVLGISVGSEDLYRNSPTGIENHSNPGANPDDIVAFIQATRNAIANTPLEGTLVGHVDTWTAFVNSSNDAVIAASDFLGMDAYPYYQTTMTNDITQGAPLFKQAYQATVAASQGKPVWITETGWPYSGPQENDAVASAANAQTYWDQVGCDFAFDKIPTFWYDLVDTGAIPSFGVTDGGPNGPLYDLSCSS